MKKIISALIVLSMFFSVAAQNVVFAASCTLDVIEDVQQGEMLTISGSAQGENYYVTLYVKDSSGAVKLVDSILTSSGKFSKSIMVPYTWSQGKYKVIAGFGKTVATREFEIKSVGKFLGIDDLVYTVDQYSEFALPEKIVAKYENNAIEFLNPKYMWDNELDLNVAGTYTGTGKITDMYKVERTFNIKVIVNPITINEILTDLNRYEFEVNDKIELDSTADVKLSNGAVKSLPVLWTPNPESIIAQEAGEMEFTGVISGYSGEIKARVTILERNEDIPVAGLRLWTEATEDTIILSGGRVNKWIDKSKNKNDLISAGSEAPAINEDAVNGHMSLVFKNSKLISEKSDKYVGGSTIFIVSKINSKASDGGIFTTTKGLGEKNDIELHIKGGVASAASNGESDFACFGNQSADTSEFHISGIRVSESKENGAWKKSVIDTYYDGKINADIFTADKSGAEFNTHAGYTVGCRAKNKYSDIEVCEILVYQKTLSDAQVKRVSDYLNDKYALNNKYSVSAYAGISGQDLVISSNLTNSTSKDLENAALIQTVSESDIMVASVVGNTGLVEHTGGKRIKNTIPWSGSAAALKTKAFVLKDLSALEPLAVSGYNGYVSNWGSSAAVISNISVLNDKVTVSGKLPLGKNKLALGFIMSDSTGTVTKENLYNADSIITEDDGSFELIMYMPDKDKGGVQLDKEFYVAVSGENCKKSEIGSFGYASEAKRTETFNKLKTASAAEIQDMLKKDSEYRNSINSLGVSTSMYDALSDKGKLEFAENLKNAASQTTSSGKEGISDMSDKLISVYPIVEINSAANSNAVLEILKKYNDKLNFESKGDEKDKFAADYIYNNIPIKDNSDLSDKMAETEIFYSINKANYVSLSGLLTSDIIDLASNKSFYLSASENVKQEINKNIILSIVNNPVYTKAGIASVLDSAVNTYRSGTSGGSTSGGGGGGGNPGKKNQPGNIVIDDISPEQANELFDNKIFSDLESVPWAEKAIINLKQKNIVSGKGDKKYSPNDFVTREEFVKMLVALCGIEPKSEELSFADCKNDAWYYPYVSAAVANGIVYGLNDEQFGIGQNINRAQMAAMCERAADYLKAELAEKDALIEFSDSSLIPEYAIESVLKLQRAGILHGKNDNMFDPMGNATRAEAAVIINALLEITQK